MLSVFFCFCWFGETCSVFFILLLLMLALSFNVPRSISSDSCVHVLYHTPNIPLYPLLHHSGLIPSWLLLSLSHAFLVHSHMWKSEGRSGSGWLRLGLYLGLEWVDGFMPTHTQNTHIHSSKIISIDSDKGCFPTGHRLLQFNTGLVSIFLC